MRGEKTDKSLLEAINETIAEYNKGKNLTFRNPSKESQAIVQNLDNILKDPTKQNLPKQDLVNELDRELKKRKEGSHLDTLLKQECKEKRVEVPKTLQRETREKFNEMFKDPEHGKFLEAIKETIIRYNQGKGLFRNP